MTEPKTLDEAIAERDEWKERTRRWERRSKKHRARYRDLVAAIDNFIDRVDDIDQEGPDATP